jgi:hypothetical protein
MVDPDLLASILVGGAGLALTVLFEERRLRDLRQQNAEVRNLKDAAETSASAAEQIYEHVR